MHENISIGLKASLLKISEDGEERPPTFTKTLQIFWYFATKSVPFAVKSFAVHFSDVT
jgi:hypothetical protein